MISITTISIIFLNQLFNNRGKLLEGHFAITFKIECWEDGTPFCLFILYLLLFVFFRSVFSSENGHGIAFREQKLLVRSWKDLFELVDFYIASLIDVKNMECPLDILCGQHLFMVECRRYEFLEINLTITCEIAIA